MPADTHRSNKSTARCRWPPFPHALIAALYVITSGLMTAATHHSDKSKARSRWPPFSHALIAELYVITFGWLPAATHMQPVRDALPRAALLARKDR
jgi:hypothetical protein